MNSFLPSSEQDSRHNSNENKYLEIAQGIPTHEGVLAKIFHPKDSNFCISVPLRSLSPIDTAWEEKIRQMKDTRVKLDSTHSFSHLFVPRVLWKSESRSIAKIEWVEGVHLDSINVGYTLDGPSIDVKMKFVREYLLYLDLLHSSSSCVVDNKPSSQVATKSGGKGWRLGLVDVSVQEKQELAKQFSETDPWKIETMSKNDLSKTLISMFGTLDSDTIKDYVYGLGIPHAIRQLGLTISSFDSAQEAINQINQWLQDMPTSMDMKMNEIGETIQVIKGIVTKDDNYARSREISLGLLSDHFYGIRKSSDRQIATSLASLAKMKYLSEK